MGDFMRVTTRMIRSMAMEFTLGLIKSNIRVGGTTESNMDWEFLLLKKERRSLEYGKMERSFGGSVKMRLMPSCSEYFQ